MKRFLAGLLGLSLLVTMVGCDSRDNQGSEPSSSSDTTSLPEPVAIEQLPDLAFWWDEYIADLLYLLQRSYPLSPVDDQRIITEFCLTKYARDVGFAADDKARNPSMPMDKLTEYAKRYFGLPNLDSYDYSHAELDESGNISMYSQALFYEAEGEMEDFAFKLLSAEEVSTGVVEVVVGHKDSPGNSSYPSGYSAYRTFTFVHTGENKYYLRSCILNSESSGQDIEVSGDVRRIYQLGKDSTYRHSYTKVLDGGYASFTFGNELGVGGVTLFSLENGEELASIYPLSAEHIENHSSTDLLALRDENALYIAKPDLSQLERFEFSPQQRKLLAEPITGQICIAGDRLLVSNRDGVYLCSYRSGQMRQLLDTSGQNRYYSAIELSPDGEYLQLSYSEPSEKGYPIVHALYLLEIESAQLWEMPGIDISTSIIPEWPLMSQSGTLRTELLSAPMTNNRHRISLHSYQDGEELASFEVSSGLNTEFRYIGGDRLLMVTTRLSGNVRRYEFSVVDAAAQTVSEPVASLTTTSDGERLHTLSIIYRGVNRGRAVLQINSPWADQSCLITIGLK